MLPGNEAIIAVNQQHPLNNISLSKKNVSLCASTMYKCKSHYGLANTHKINIQLIKW